VEFGGFTPFEWLAMAEHELLLFAGIFFLIGGLDELLMDLSWLWLRLSGRAPTPGICRARTRETPLAGGAAVLIPAWNEAAVLATTVAHACAAWPQRDLTIYAGCYGNDPETAAAVIRGARGDPRVRLVVHGRSGPTTKADCLNRLYRALCDDEARRGRPARMVVLHDAEDMVDPAALALLDHALESAEFVQLPVLPAPQPASRWVGNHYCEEFAEAHAKAMVVRGALAAALPAAGVGCAFARDMLDEIAWENGTPGAPFSEESLTEDYELGLRIKALGGRSRFLRVRGDDGHLVATRACFPDRLDAAVRQKTRWIHGIAFQGWDRLGWSARPAELWMRMRDRRGPLTGLVLAAAYLLLVIAGLLAIGEALGHGRPWIGGPLIDTLLWANMVSFAWRALFRFAFTAREYGWREAGWAVLRIPLTNIIAIMAGRRALFAYLRTFAGHAPQWDKTCHHAHPALLEGRPA
jgi:bacteriophage N4 adsorption protein B